MGDHVSLFLPNLSSSHLQDAVAPITDTPYIFRDEDDETVWWDLDSYEEVHSLVVLPVAFVITIVVVLAATCLCYVKRTRKVVRKVNSVTHRLELETNKDSSHVEENPHVENTTTNT